MQLLFKRSFRFWITDKLLTLLLFPSRSLFLTCLQHISLFPRSSVTQLFFARPQEGLSLPVGFSLKNVLNGACCQHRFQDKEGRFFKNVNWSTVPNSIELLLGARHITALCAFKNHPRVIYQIKVLTQIVWLLPQSVHSNHQEGGRAWVLHLDYPQETFMVKKNTCGVCV